MSPLAEGLEECVKNPGERLFDLHIANHARTVAGLQGLDLDFIRVEQLVIDEDGVALDTAREALGLALREVERTDEITSPVS